MRKQIGMAFAASLAMSGTVFAQDLGDGKWFGPFVGGQVSQMDYSETGTVNNSYPLASLRGSSAEFDATTQDLIIFGGHDFQVNNQVFGYEVGLLLGGSEGSGETLGLSYKIGVDLGYYARFRGGFAFDRVLVYGSLGYISYESSGTTQGTIENVAINIEEEYDYRNFEGGVGIEYLITDNFSVRGEYNFSFSSTEIEDDYIDNYKATQSRIGLGAAWRL